MKIDDASNEDYSVVYSYLKDMWNNKASILTDYERFILLQFILQIDIKQENFEEAQEIDNILKEDYWIDIKDHLERYKTEYLLQKDKNNLFDKMITNN